MAKLDFRELYMPVYELTMMDGTDITVTHPNEGLVEELEAMASEVETIFSADNPDVIDEVYKLAAQLISCNKQGLSVSADDLRTKYWPEDKTLNQLALLSFISEYMNFLDEIKKVKN